VYKMIGESAIDLLTWNGFKPIDCLAALPKLQYSQAMRTSNQESRTNAF
jgi:hypothetical protein